MGVYNLDVDTGRPYRVHIGTYLLEQVGAVARNAAGGNKAVIVTDSNVGPLYAQPVRLSLEKAGYTVDVFTFEAGEEHKRLTTISDILEFMAVKQLTRKDIVVALGGGVVGDMAGFAAASYMRGIEFIQVPTSLLAMVDSSVGGKTGVDLAAGKNLAGAFWQPAAVLADVGCLNTLSPQQFADGCGEVIKHGVIADAELFEELEKTPLTLELLQKDVDRVSLLVARNIDIKRAVVAADERETGQRKLLNFGHSIGHAVEACEEYKLGHGNCVAIGMCAMSRASASLGFCDGEVADRIWDLCQRHGLETACRFTDDQVYHEALHDKKRSGDAIDIVIPHRIGACSIESVALEYFHDLIRRGLTTEGDF